MKYKCLVFDHDDTVVNSTATIHHPCFQTYLNLKRPGQSCSLNEYFLKNFDPGFLEMCRDEYGMDDAELREETEFWNNYVQTIIPEVYPGIRELMWEHKEKGGLICVSSHSFSDNIRRDYAANSLPEPDAVYGWELPHEKRKPRPFSMRNIIERFALQPAEILMIDDLQFGYEMAASCGVDFAAAGWAYDIPEIERYMRKNCGRYFKTVRELAGYLRE